MITVAAAGAPWRMAACRRTSCDANGKNIHPVAIDCSDAQQLGAQRVHCLMT
ncbi:hypothetical protein GGR60_003859 [Xanthomonas arboricola]|uniref:hypothetical protein n=1 Tax=Xanthomonas euroxanthea TaxID=2259622 RepID=UPI001430EEFA|nr:hypothetical protein [Xanthomonas euroxanthea]NJC39284.1 hypothetical protein [Xanthomonas euroxanthea]